MLLLFLFDTILNFSLVSSSVYVIMTGFFDGISYNPFFSLLLNFLQKNKKVLAKY